MVIVLRLSDFAHIILCIIRSYCCLERKRSVKIFCKSFTRFFLVFFVFLFSFFFFFFNCNIL